MSRLYASEISSLSGALILNSATSQINCSGKELMNVTVSGSVSVTPPLDISPTLSTDPAIRVTYDTATTFGLVINGSGEIALGNSIAAPDVFIRHGAANTLYISATTGGGATGGIAANTFTATTSVSTPQITTSGTTISFNSKDIGSVNAFDANFISGDQMQATPTLTTGSAFSVKTGAESNARYNISGAAEVQWGSGSATRDTYLYRDAASSLTLSASTLGAVGGTLKVGTLVATSITNGTSTLLQYSGSTIYVGTTYTASATPTTSVYMGTNAGNATASGASNVAVGGNAGQALTTGNNNIAIGNNSLFTNLAGFDNVAIGSSALYNSTASNNAAIGAEAMRTMTTGTQNTAVGVRSLYNQLTGSSNVAIGYQAGFNNTGSDNIFIGHSADATGALNNIICIGQNVSSTTSNSTVIGNSSTTTATIRGSTSIVQPTATTAALTIQTTAATATLPTYQFIQPKVLTTNATVTTLYTASIATSTTTMIESYVVARRTGGLAGTAEDSAVFRLMSGYKNNAGVVTAINSASPIKEAIKDQASWDVTYVISTTNVVISVTGALDNNISWIGCIKLMTVNA